MSKDKEETHVSHAFHEPKVSVPHVAHEATPPKKPVKALPVCATPLCAVIEAILTFETDGKTATRVFLPRSLAWDIARLPAAETGALFHDLLERGPAGLKTLYGCVVTLTTEDAIRVE